MQANLLKQSTNDHDLRLHRLFKLPVWHLHAMANAKFIGPQTY